MTLIAQILARLAAPVAVPHWAACLGALCIFIVVIQCAFLVWCLRWLRDMYAESEHD